MDGEMCLAQCIKEKRMRMGLSQRALAERMNTTQQTIAQWESGKRIPRGESLRKIAEALDMSIDALLGLGPEKMTEFSRLEEMKRGIDEIIGNIDDYSGEELKTRLQMITCFAGVEKGWISQNILPTTETAGEVSEEKHSLRLSSVVEDLYSVIGQATPQEQVETLGNVIIDMCSRMNNVVREFNTGQDALLTAYNRLNEKGQQLAIERLEELAQIPSYAKGASGE